jgi:hypothetical protein
MRGQGELLSGRRCDRTLGHPDTDTQLARHSCLDWWSPFHEFAARSTTPRVDVLAGHLLDIENIESANYLK